MKKILHILNKYHIGQSNKFLMMTCNIIYKKNMHQLYINHLDSVKYVHVGNFYWEPKDKRLTLDGGPEDTVVSIFHSLRERLDTLALAMGWSSSVRTFTVNSDHTQQQVWFGFSTQTNFRWIQYTDKFSTTCSKANTQSLQWQFCSGPQIHINSVWLKFSIIPYMILSG